jgi:mRNA interferase MazF
LARFVKGDVVVVPFPFLDLTQAKRRPALVLAEVEGDDLILCQITSQVIRDAYAIPLVDSDFATGGLQRSSYARPNRVFTADRRIVLYPVGRLLPGKLDAVVERLVEILRQ